MTQLLSIGSSTTLVQNVVYALPAKPSVVTTSAACETSINGTVWTAFTSGGTTTAKFIRSAVVNTLVSVGAAVAGAGGGVPADIVATTLALGTNPALTGIIRLSNNQIIKARNSTNTGDLDLIAMNQFNQVVIGNGTSTSTYYSNVQFTSGGFLGGVWSASGHLNLANTSWLSFDKRAAPAVPAATRAHLWIEDSAGKGRLMVQFGTGTAIQIAIEP
jgi:hypothetical protein